MLITWAFIHYLVFIHHLYNNELLLSIRNCKQKILFCKPFKNQFYFSRASYLSMGSKSGLSLPSFLPSTPPTSLAKLMTFSFNYDCFVFVCIHTHKYTCLQPQSPLSTACIDMCPGQTTWDWRTYVAVHPQKELIPLSPYSLSTDSSLYRGQAIGISLSILLYLLVILCPSSAGNQTITISRVHLLYLV